MASFELVCPYCKHCYRSEGDIKIGHVATTCLKCKRMFVVLTKWKLVHEYFAMEEVKPHEEQCAAVKEKEDTAIHKKGWCRVPGTGATYYPTPMHVSLQYQNCSPACIGWDDIEYLLSIGRENRPREIARTLLDKGLARQKLAVRMFLKAIEHDRIPHWRTL